MEQEQKQARAIPVPLDGNMVQEISGGDNEIAAELLARFMHYNAGDVRKLRESLACGDLGAVTQNAHRIKGAARTIGANALALTCEAIDAAAHSQDAGAAFATLGRLETEVRALHEYISSHWGVAPDADRS